MNARDDLRRAARSIYDATLAGMDARAAVRRALDFTPAGRLTILDTEFDLHARPLAIYSIAAGKAAGEMASALDEVLGGALAGGVVSAPTAARSVGLLSGRWRVFAGGHPLPDEASLDAARAAFALLREADAAAERALVIFLISGGGSAMLEWPRDESITLAELREANRALVACGAGIDEINSVRRAFSSVKGGGLSERARRAAHISLIISDTKRDEPHNVASGPTFAFAPDSPDPSEVVNRYGLAARLPASILRVIDRPRPSRAETDHAAATAAGAIALRRHHVLLDNERALERAAEVAAALGFAVEVARDVSDQGVEEGATLLVSRLLDLRRREKGGRGVCLISGGEFSCPVRGPGVGGRNAETVLRCAFEIEARAARSPFEANGTRVVALSAGTDGIDGNSPAAGALGDDTTLARARSRSLDARGFLEASDAHTLFAALGDAITTGATGTNVRDLRLLLAS